MHKRSSNAVKNVIILIDVFAIGKRRIEDYDDLENLKS